MAETVVAWTSGAGAAVQCWDLATGQPVHACKAMFNGSKSPYGIALAGSAGFGSPGGLIIAALSERSTVLVYDWAREQPRLRCAVPSSTTTSSSTSQSSSSSSSSASSSSSGVNHSSQGDPMGVASGGGLSSSAATHDSHFFCAGGGSGSGHASSSSSVFAWQISTGRLLRAFPGHHRGVRCMRFTPDDAFLLTGGGDALLKVWATSSVLALDSNLPTDMSGQYFSSHSAGGSSENTDALFGGDSQRDTTTQSAVTPWHVFRDHTLAVTGVACGLTGAAGRIASSSLDATMKLWSLSARRLIASVVYPTPLNDCCLDPAETRAFVAGADGRVYCTDLNTVRSLGDMSVLGRQQTAFGDAGEQSITSVATSADGELVIASSLNGTVSVFDVRSGQLVRELRTPHRAPVAGVRTYLRSSPALANACGTSVRATDMGLDATGSSGMAAAGADFAMMSAEDSASDPFASMLGGGDGSSRDFRASLSGLQKQGSSKMAMSVNTFAKFAPPANAAFECVVRASAGAHIEGDTDLLADVAKRYPVSAAGGMGYCGADAAGASGLLDPSFMLGSSDAASPLSELVRLRAENHALQAENARWKSLGSELYGIATSAVVDGRESTQ